MRQDTDAAVVEEEHFARHLRISRTHIRVGTHVYPIEEVRAVAIEEGAPKRPAFVAGMLTSVLVGAAWMLGSVPVGVLACVMGLLCYALWKATRLRALSIHTGAGAITLLDTTNHAEVSRARAAIERAMVGHQV